MPLKLKTTFFILLLIVKFSFAHNSVQHSLHKNGFSNQFDSVKINLDLLEKLVIKKLNIERQNNNLDLFSIKEILDLPAEDQAKYMAKNNELLDIQMGRKKYPSDRMTFYGGSKQSKELILQIDFDYNIKQFSWEKIADKIVKRLTVLRYYKQLTLNPNYFFIGIGISANKQFSSLFITVILGNYKSFNYGTKKREESHIPYYASFFSNNIRHAYGYLPYDEKECLRVNKIKNIDALYSGLYIKNNEIYLSLPNNKLLKKVLTNGKDRLAVDIIPQKLYTCESENLIDNNQLNKGILIKGLNKNQISRKNQANDKSKSIEVKLGSLKYIQDLSGYRKIDSIAELNLYVIKNKHICKIITPSFNEFNKIKQNNSSGLLADTSLTESIDYIENELFRKTSSLIFNIPFRKNKYEYKKSDIEPIIQALHEPKFQIKNIKITAFSSIEGSEKNNIFLQNARAQSIVKVFQKLYSDSLNYTINTSNSWEQFKLDVFNTEFDTIAGMQKSEALNYISKNKLMNKLEPLLQKERYAHVELEILYDTITTSKEELIVNKINKYIKQNYVEKAELIHKYFIKEIINGKYKGIRIHDIKIPDKPKFAKIRMNQLWLEKYIAKEWLYESDFHFIEHLHEQNSNDFYILYNWIYSSVLFMQKINLVQIKKIYEEIDTLNTFHISTNLVSALKFRMLLIENKYTIEYGSQKEKIKKLKEIESFISNENEAIEIAKILAASADYDYAIELLAKYIGLPNTSVNLLFTFITLCSHERKMLNTKLFEIAVKQILIINPTFFCNLLKSNKITFQVLENPIIKKLYCSKCK
ncbi:MAG: hypothetical protein GXO79_15825 [Chlorobi bacterium]|nr:hypothetical protein [Chlorobiota bacterium]